MGVRTRGLDIKAGAAKLKADRAARLEAELVVDRWNRRLATGRDMLWSPTIRAALIAGTPGSTSSVPAAGRAGRSISGPSIVTRWPRSARWCSACGAHGVRDRRRCRSCARYRRLPARGRGRYAPDKRTSRYPIRLGGQSASAGLACASILISVSLRLPPSAFPP